MDNYTNNQFVHQKLDLCFHCEIILFMHISCHLSNYSEDSNKLTIVNLLFCTIVLILFSFYNKKSFCLIVWLFSMRKPLSILSFLFPFYLMSLYPLPAFESLSLIMSELIVIWSIAMFCWFLEIEAPWTYLVC